MPEIKPARVLMAVLVLGLAFLAWKGQFTQPTLLEQIQERGHLTIITRISPTTYYQSREGATGLEYDLAKRFADHLGVKLNIIVATDMMQIFQALATRQADIAAAGLTVTDARRKRFRFTAPYMTVHQELIYRVDNGRPSDLGDLDGTLEVLADSSHVDRLEHLKHTKYPDLQWMETSKYSSEEMLYRVWNREVDYTIADSNEFTLNQRFYPELRAAFSISGPQEMAWALPPTKDKSLYEAADKFFADIRVDGTLTHLIEKYYGHLGKFDYVGTRVFLQDVTKKLPRYRHQFVAAAEKYKLDWRLLAAISYQESHWDPKAVSPTGVRGLMMLTQDAAQHIGVANRLDPKQSIWGGARYFALMLDKVPDRITEPVRTWLALAAYNVGYGHLEDARVLTEMQGGNPDAWGDVKKRLPLLSQRRWYTRVEHGYARGWEPVRYVENIRTYYELLRRITDPGQLKTDEAPNARPQPSIPGSDGSGLNLGDQIQSTF